MIILGLGSNVGDRHAMLDAACGALSAFVSELRRSSVMETPALLPKNAPPKWDVPFLNMAVAGSCTLEPLALLAELKAIEQTLGRIDRGHWGPREIDIDILAMDDRVIENEKLCVPHKLLLTRDFALKPLAELAPGWRYPVVGEYYGKTAAELAARL